MTSLISVLIDLAFVLVLLAALAGIVAGLLWLVGRAITPKVDPEGDAKEKEPNLWP